MSATSATNVALFVALQARKCDPPTFDSILFYSSKAWIKQEFLLGFEVLFECENKGFYYIKS